MSLTEDLRYIWKRLREDWAERPVWFKTYVLLGSSLQIGAVYIIFELLTGMRKIPEAASEFTLEQMTQITFVNLYFNVILVIVLCAYFLVPRVAYAFGLSVQILVDEFREGSE